MKQKWKRIMAGFLAILTIFTTLFSNGTTAFAASASAKISFWNASTNSSGEVSELKAGYNHGKVLYAIRSERLRQQAVRLLQWMKVRWG